MAGSSEAPAAVRVWRCTLLTAEPYRWCAYGQLAAAIPEVTPAIGWMREYQGGRIDCLDSGEGES